MKHVFRWIAVLSMLGSNAVHADDLLADLSLEELVNTEVTSVSRKSQSLSDVAAAAFVITAEDIRRSGAQALPDVLRMAPGIQVAQIDNGRYAVTARGFNGRFANKLQVLIDGRSIYHPMFSGVLWELDPIPLDDIERIEIIRGAGAVMWGANAVNGVINIISKHSRNQTGGAVSVGAGTGGMGNLYARIGQRLDDDTSFKLSVQGRYVDPSTQFATGRDAEDRLENAVADFRFDRDLGAGRDLTIWANANRSSLGDSWMVNPDQTQLAMGRIVLSPLSLMQRLHSESLVGRYRWLGDSGIESSLQLSAGTSGIEITKFIDESRTTFDLDYTGRYTVGQHDLQWGFGHRTSKDEVDTADYYIQVLTPSYTHRTNGLFVHDDWTLVPETLKLGAGLRWDKASRNASAYSPHLSLLWTPTRSDSAWVKYSQAPRTTARAEQDISVLAGIHVQQSTLGNLPIIQWVNANRNGLTSEKSEGVEIGYRKQWSAAVSADIAAYRYRYTQLRSGSQAAIYGCYANFAFIPGFPFPVEPSRCPSVLSGAAVVIQEVQTNNALSGWSQGVELAVDWLVTAGWRLQLSYAWSMLDMDRDGDAINQTNARMTERAQPRHTASLRSQWNLTANQQFDLWLRAVSGLDRIDVTDATPTTSTEPSYVHIPGYVTLDLRYGLRINKDLELALSGRNLIGQHRMEYLSDYIPSIGNEIKPSWLLSARWKF